MEDLDGPCPLGPLDLETVALLLCPPCLCGYTQYIPMLSMLLSPGPNGHRQSVRHLSVLRWVQAESTARASGCVGGIGDAQAQAQPWPVAGRWRAG